MVTWLLLGVDLILEFGVGVVDSVFDLLDSVVMFDVRLVLLILHLSFHVLLTVLTLFQFFLLSLLLSDLALFFRGRCLLLRWLWG
jgi:hypothetical protein